MVRRGKEGGGREEGGGGSRKRSWKWLGSNDLLGHDPWLSTSPPPHPPPLTAQVFILTAFLATRRRT